MPFISENERLEKAMPAIKNYVSKFISKSSKNAKYITHISMEDFIQEACIAFIVFFRDHDNAPDEYIPYLPMKHAMCQLIIRMQPVSGNYGMHSFSEYINSMPFIFSADCAPSDLIEVDGMKNYWPEDVDRRLDLMAIMDSQTDLDKQIISMKLNGMKNVDISNDIGLSPVAIHKRIVKFRAIYDQMKGE